MPMETSLNWARLYSQGRCKAIGVPWTNEEMLALASGIPAIYVRLGILTKEALAIKKEEEVVFIKKTGETPLYQKSKQELLEIAKGKGIIAMPDVPEETLIQLIEQSGKKLPEKTAEEKAKVKAEAKAEKLAAKEKAKAEKLAAKVAAVKATKEDKK